jgi:hypothetical protein
MNIITRDIAYNKPMKRLINLMECGKLLPLINENIKPITSNLGVVFYTFSSKNEVFNILMPENSKDLFGADVKQERLSDTQFKLTVTMKANEIIKDGIVITHIVEMTDNLIKNKITYHMDESLFLISTVINLFVENCLDTFVTEKIKSI